MSVGLGQAKSDIDSWAYQISMGFESLFQNVSEMHAFLLATPDATLEAAPYNYSSTDVSNLKSAINDAVTLSNIYYGTSAQGATAYDFRTFLKLLRGVSCR